MFSQFTIIFAILSVSVLSAPSDYPTGLLLNSLFINKEDLFSEEQSRKELESAGMTQSSIDGLAALTHRFATGYPMVQSNKEASEKFIADYTTDATNFIKAMPAGDQTIYNNYLKKYGLA
uniref:Secreted RxLR effector peptide protein n=1 Tax=Caenorhabditis tropicalis TaxID=1561998 RepID=A0A1I7UW27_9PELO